MAYTEYINTERIQTHDMSMYTYVGQYVEGDGSVLNCINHGVVLLEEEPESGDLLFGCTNCGYREEWEYQG